MTPLAYMIPTGPKRHATGNAGEYANARAGILKCQALVKETKDSLRPCSRYGRVRYGDIYLCRQHVRLANVAKND